MNPVSKQLIVIRGPVGAGKTSVVEALRSKLGDVSIIDFDVFKRQIDNTTSSDWRRKISLDTALYLCDQLMKRERLIVVDIHSSYRDQLDKYLHLARRNKYIATSFLLNPSLETCIERAIIRNVPDITYNIDKSMIGKYWKNTFFIDGEIVFDNPNMTPSEIADKITEQVII